MSRSYSQNGQDRFVIDQVFSGKRDGYFVEAGAGDGMFISNTLLLEREYGWTGVLVEPTRAFAALRVNRPGCVCENTCLAGERKAVIVMEVFDRGQAGLSLDAADNLLLSCTVESLPEQNAQTPWSHWGQLKRHYPMQAEPLADVLQRCKAPTEIDYISLDVEGTEYDILRTFPFDRYRFGCLGIERPNDTLVSLLVTHGYAPVGRVGEDTFFLPYNRQKWS